MQHKRQLGMFGSNLDPSPAVSKMQIHETSSFEVKQSAELQKTSRTRCLWISSERYHSNSREVSTAV